MILRMLAILAVAVLGIACHAPSTIPRPPLWAVKPPPITKPGDRFTVRVLELDTQGWPKDRREWSALRQAAGKAEDIFVFIHGWRRDAHDVATMKAFLRIYRGAFDCLSSRDEAGGLSCASIHAYCHPGDRSSKLVVLILWDGYSGPLGFRSIQTRALRIGRSGLSQDLAQLHADLGGRGTLLVLGHSLGGAMVASAIQQGLATGRMPMDGAILVVGAFDTGMLGGLEPAPMETGRGLFLLNLTNPRDGYLHAYRWVTGHAAAGAAGIAGIPTRSGKAWAGQGIDCRSARITTLGASMWDAASPRLGPKGTPLEMLNLNMEGLVRSHVDIEDERAIQLYNRAAADLLFQVLWTRSHPPGREGG